MRMRKTLIAGLCLALSISAAPALAQTVGANVTVNKVAEEWVAAPAGALSVTSFGAVGDGKTDNSKAFRSAIASAGQLKVPLYIPPGRFLVKESITIDHPVVFAGSGRKSSVITSEMGVTRFYVRHSKTAFQDLGFENMIEPIALQSREGYSLDDVRIERCRFENMRVNTKNRGTIGLASGNSTHRIHPIRRLVVRDTVFRNIDAHAIGIRANISEAHIVNNQFYDIVNSRLSGDEGITGAKAIGMGESSDDSGQLQEYAGQGRHVIENNIMRNLRKQTVTSGSVYGVGVYGNYNKIRNNLIEDIAGPADKATQDVEAIFVRGAYNEVRYNTIRNAVGGDDDGFVSFKGGLDLGSVHNVISHNLVENVSGSSAFELSTSHLQFHDNVVINASPRGFDHRSGTGMSMRNNTFIKAGVRLRAQYGEEWITGNRFIDSSIWMSGRTGYPIMRDGIYIHNNYFRRNGGKSVRTIAFGNDIEEKFVSIRGNRFENWISETGGDTLVNLVTNAKLQKFEIIGNYVEQYGPKTEVFRTGSIPGTLSNNTVVFLAFGTQGDTSAPSVPQNLAASVASSSQVNLSWSAATDNVGVTGYKLYRNDAHVATASGTTFQDKSLAAGTTYTWQVSAVDAAGNESARSTAVKATTLAASTTDTSAPSIPQNLSGKAVSSSQVDLTWSASTDNVGVTGYKVYRNDKHVANASSTTFQDKSLASGTSYTYQVSAMDVAGNESARSTAVKATTVAAADVTPPVISSVSVSETTASSALITWKTNEPATSRVEFGTSKSYGSSLDNATLKTSHSIRLTGLRKNTAYHFRVLSTDAAGNTATSDNKSFRTRNK
jgi:chitodextrinase